MTNPIDIVNAEIQRNDEERRQSMREEQQALAAIARLRARIAEFDAIDASLQRVLKQLLESSQSRMAVSSELKNGKREVAGGVRGIMHEYFIKTPSFSDEAIIAHVRGVIPDAKAGTIRAELS